MPLFPPPFVIGLIAISAVGSSVSSGTVVFSNSNNVTFGMSGATITASVAGGGGGGIAAAAGTQTAITGTIVLANSNGISFGMSGSSQITASFSTLIYSNSHNVSFGIVGSTLTASVVVPAQSTGPAALSAGTTQATSGTISFADSNGVSFGLDGQTITASILPPTPETPFAVSANGGSQSTGTITFANGGNVSFGYAAGVITATATFPAQTAFVLSNSNNVSFGTNGSTVTANATFPAETPFGVSAGTQSASTGTLVFSNSNGVTFGMSGSSRITASVDAIKSISGGTTRASGGEVVFSNSNGVSFGLDGNTMTASVDAGVTLNYWNPQDAYAQVTGNQGQATLHVQPGQAPNVTFDRVIVPVYFSGASNSTMTLSYTQLWGVFTRTGSTLSQLMSTSITGTLGHSGNVNSALNNGVRLLTIPFASSLSADQYYFVNMQRSSSSSANATFAQILASQLNSNFSGILGVASNATIQYTRGLGVYTASSTGIPVSIAFSQINGSNSLVLRQPIFYVANGTF